MIAPRRLGTVAAVELWTWTLDLDPQELAARWSRLSVEERERAGRLAAGDVRRRFVAGRAGLRALLCDWTGASPGELALRSGPHGKPMLESGPHFNLSHSGDLAVCALAPDREVGVDVEGLRPVPEAGPIAERWLGPDAPGMLAAAGTNREVVFLRLWTRREAFLKASGVGIAAAEDRQPQPDPGRWETWDIDPAPGYVGALVAARAPSAERGRRQEIST